MAMLMVAALLGVAAWLVVPPWRDERVDRVTGPGHVHMAAHWQTTARILASRWQFGPAARRRQARRRVDVIHALGILAADLQAGQPPTIALAAAGGSPSTWPNAAGAARLGEDVAAALIIDSEQSPVLRHLAACWHVATESGSGLASAVGRLATSARAAEDVRGQLEAELAGPRATARTLAFLPLVGVAFGVLMGADPVGWLIGSSLGWGCLVVGTGLTAIGAWWTGRIAARVEAML